MRSAGRRWSVQGARHCRKSQQLVMQGEKPPVLSYLIKTDGSTSVIAILETHVQPGCNALDDSELSFVKVGFTDSWIDLRAVCK